MNNLKINDFDDSTSELDPELILQATLENPNLVQQITRTRENGIETFVGYFRVEFSPNQKRYVLHVPFVPPFGGLPQVEAHSSDHDDVRIRIADCQKYGLRVEVILSQPSDSTQNRMVELVAIESEENDVA